MTTIFIDALQLATRDFSETRVVVLCGESGSGKSSAIRFMLREHAQLGADPRLRVIEELRDWRDLGVFLKALAAGHRLLVASHLPVWLHCCLGALAATEVIALDRHPEKISRWLIARRIQFSDAAVAAFCRDFGANYTDAALILQHSEAQSFDQALGRFMKQCALVRGGIPDDLPVRLMRASEAEAHYRNQP